LATSTIELTEGKLSDVTTDEFDTFLQQIEPLKRLQILHLLNNPLTTLPESIGQFTIQMALTIGQNRLSALTESIGNLTSLKHLIIEKKSADLSTRIYGPFTKYRRINPIQESTNCSSRFHRSLQTNFYPISCRQLSDI